MTDSADRRNLQKSNMPPKIEYKGISKKLKSGINDLKTLYPEIAAEWDYENNGDLTPDMVLAHSSYKAWWICARKHRWEAMVYARSSGHGCPYCAGLKPIPGENDLATLCPEVAAQWNYEKNGDLTPDMVLPHSQKKVWWVCEKKHQWNTTIAHRTEGCRCPYCAGKKIIVGETDLATLYPNIAKEWDYEKNGNLSPNMVFPHSDKKFWWVCKRNHQWKASASNRLRGKGCPYCAGKKPIPGETDFKTLYPDIAKEWCYEENGNLTPDMVTAHSNKNVWWICGEKHQWCTTINNRTSGKSCPYCAGLKPVAGKTDLATLYPNLVKEWDYEKNGNLSPNMVAAHSGKKVWWICTHKHQWGAQVYNRTLGGANCPYCSGKRKYQNEGVVDKNLE